MFNVPPGANSGVEVDRQEGDAAPIADPFADLLLSVAAVIVLTVIAILPTIPRQSPVHDDRFRFHLEGRAVHPFVAVERGLIVGEASSRMVPVDRIFFDEGVVAILERMRAAGDAVVLFIEPKGFEPAFQFEVIANRHGPARMHQIRLESECSRTRYCHELIPISAEQRQ